MQRDQKKRDRKRKKRQEEKKRQARQAESLAYLGNKYKSDKLIQTWMHTEIGIYETYVMTDRKLVDQTVASSLETLIRMLRAGTLPPITEAETIDYQVGQEENLLIENIRRNWANHFATEWKPPKDQLIGVLRSILGSIQKVKSPGPQSQSYMKHIAGFLTKKLGVSVKAFSADGKPLPEPKEDELVRLGRQWESDGDLEARAELFELAAELMRSGQTRRVIDACHLLIGEIADLKSEVVAELMDLRHKASQSLITAMG
jgi:hypothetical protein